MEALDTFFELQLDRWGTARENHEALTKIWMRKLDSPRQPVPLRVQCNPARLVSTGANIDKASIAARPCFLCAANRPEEQHELALNEEFEWLVNPYPILQEHYTIAAKQHRPQRFLDAYEAMIQATKQLSEEYIVFYNGPKCGASAPDHLHLQAGQSNGVPLIEYARGITAESSIQTIAPFGYIAYLIHDAEDANTLNKLYQSLPIPEGEYEPRMNVVAYRKDGKVCLLVIPRRAHRPRCYHDEGEAKFLISPGALDMCGLIITPRTEDYERLTAARAADILCEVGVRSEPTIDVGIMQGKEIVFTINGMEASPIGLQARLLREEKSAFVATDAIIPHCPPEGEPTGFTRNHQLILPPGTYHASIKEDIATGKTLIIIKGEDVEYTLGNSVLLAASPTFTLHGVTIGKDFHWQQQEIQTFQGALNLRIIDGELHAINRIAIEDYLTSVIASEMSVTSSVELLKAHAVISRSWLLAQIGVAQKLKIENSKLKVDQASHESDSQKGSTLEAKSQFSTLNSQFIKWYDREAHAHFDVCADDHCQRYQGVSRKVTPQVHEAIRATQGIVLSYDGEVCDARFSKCCGGRTELYESCWDDTPHPYLSVVDDPFCNTDDPKILSEVLNHYDQSTDFYRWTVQYTQAELSDLVRRRSGFDYGDIIDLIPIERGPSGRIVRLQIVGTKATRIIGKELEIRRTLSETHLYSSAFEVEKVEVFPPTFILHGTGWGHGVGLCQIGAAVMGAKGYNYKEILHHYYPEAELTEWYTPRSQCSPEMTVST